MKADFFGIEFNDVLERLKKSQELLLTQLKKKKPISRDEIIQNDYFERLKKDAPWISSLPNGVNRPKIDSQKSVLKSEILSVDTAITKINQHNELKMIVISDFLIQFLEISEMDRQVLMESFNALDSAHLKAELEKIIQLFKS